MVFRAELENEAQTNPNMVKNQIFIKKSNFFYKNSIFYKNRFFYRGGGIGRRPFKYFPYGVAPPPWAGGPLKQQKIAYFKGLRPMPPPL